MVELMTVMDMRYIIVRSVNGKLTMILKQEIEFSSDYASVTNRCFKESNLDLSTSMMQKLPCLYLTFNVLTR